MVLIPIGTSVSSAIEMAGLKEVLCEHCQCHFVYVAKRTGTAEGLAPLFLFQEAAQQSAENAAYMRASNALRKAVDLAPCPDCSRFQRHMVNEMRLRICKGAAIAALVFFFPALLFAWAGMGKQLIEPAGPRIAASLGLELAAFAAIAVSLLAVFAPNAGRLFPFGKANVTPTMRAEQYFAAVEEQKREQAQLEARRAEELKNHMARTESENAVRQEQARLKKEEEARRMAERAGQRHEGQQR